MANILLVDDDQTLNRVICMNLEKKGFSALSAFDGAQCIQILKEKEFDCLVLDLNMPNMSGMDVLKHLHSQGFPCPVVVLTAYEKVDLAVEALKLGAFDYLTKPFDRDKLSHAIHLAIRSFRMEKENSSLKKILQKEVDENLILPQDPLFCELLEKAARSNEPVLILGETGTGKELIARWIHTRSSSLSYDFVAINCSAIPRDLLESELFGHVKGAFTGADNARKGHLFSVGRGTLFLDEIGDMPFDLQAKLLRVVENRKFTPVGSSMSLNFEGRIVSATNANLDEKMKQGLFREDLYYRLSTFPIVLSPLSHRLSQMNQFLKLFLPDYEISLEVLEWFKSRQWKGNFRELKNFCIRIRACIAHLNLQVNDLLHLESFFFTRKSDYGFFIPGQGFILDDFIDKLIQQALQRNGGNQTQAARMLGITRQQLIHRIRKNPDLLPG